MPFLRRPEVKGQLAHRRSLCAGHEYDGAPILGSIQCLARALTPKLPATQVEVGLAVFKPTRLQPKHKAFASEHGGQNR